VDDWPRAVRRSAGKILKRAPEGFRRSYRKFLQLKGGRKVAGKFSQFNGIPVPTEIMELRGHGKKVPFAGMGKVPWIEVADGNRKRRVRGPWLGAFSGSGRNIWLFKRRGMPKKSRWKYLGRVVKTVYEPTRDMERAGSPKAGTQWHHEHHDERGKWPKAFMDQNGNVRYARGTYRIGRWIRR